MVKKFIGVAILCVAPFAIGGGYAAFFGYQYVLTGALIGGGVVGAIAAIAAACEMVGL